MRSNLQNEKLCVQETRPTLLELKNALENETVEAENEFGKIDKATTLLVLNYLTQVSEKGGTLKEQIEKIRNKNLLENLEFLPYFATAFTNEFITFSNNDLNKAAEEWVDKKRGSILDLYENLVPGIYFDKSHENLYIEDVQRKFQEWIDRPYVSLADLDVDEISRLINEEAVRLELMQLLNDCVYLPKPNSTWNDLFGEIGTRLSLEPVTLNDMEHFPNDINENVKLLQRKINEYMDITRNGVLEKSYILEELILLISKLNLHFTSVLTSDDLYLKVFKSKHAKEIVPYSKFIKKCEREIKLQAIQNTKKTNADVKKTTETEAIINSVDIYTQKMITLYGKYESTVDNILSDITKELTYFERQLKLLIDNNYNLSNDVYNYFSAFFTSLERINKKIGNISESYKYQYSTDLNSTFTHVLRSIKYNTSRKIEKYINDAPKDLVDVMVAVTIKHEGVFAIIIELMSEFIEKQEMIEFQRKLITKMYHDEIFYFDVNVVIEYISNFCNIALDSKPSLYSTIADMVNKTRYQVRKSFDFMSSALNKPLPYVFPDLKNQISSPDPECEQANTTAININDIQPGDKNVKRVNLLFSAEEENCILLNNVTINGDDNDLHLNADGCDILFGDEDENISRHVRDKDLNIADNAQIEGRVIWPQRTNAPLDPSEYSDSIANCDSNSGSTNNLDDNLEWFVSEVKPRENKCRGSNLKIEESVSPTKPNYKTNTSPPSKENIYLNQKSEAIGSTPSNSFDINMLDHTTTHSNHIYSPQSNDLPKNTHNLPHSTPSSPQNCHVTQPLCQNGIVLTVTVEKSKFPPDMSKLGNFESTPNIDDYIRSLLPTVPHEHYYHPNISFPKSLAIVQPSSHQIHPDISSPKSIPNKFETPVPIYSNPQLSVKADNKYSCANCANLVTKIHVMSRTIHDLISKIVDLETSAIIKQKSVEYEQPEFHACSPFGYNELTYIGNSR